MFLNYVNRVGRFLVHQAQGIIVPLLITLWFFQKNIPQNHETHRLLENTEVLVGKTATLCPLQYVSKLLFCL